MNSGLHYDPQKENNTDDDRASLGHCQIYMLTATKKKTLVVFQVGVGI